MSYKSTLVRFAIKQAPKKMVLWLANKKTKDIAKLTDFNFDLEERKLYAQLLLTGEEEAVELWIEDFTLVPHEESFRIAIHQVQSNRPWLDILLAKFVLEREWRVPEKHADLIHELLASEDSEQEEVEE
jgi:hypothetical protein